MAEPGLISVVTTLFQGLNISIPVQDSPPSLGTLITTVTSVLATINLNDDINLRSEGKGTPPTTYDFIIVGSGSAGGIIANRLSESGKFQVLLLEAGGDPTALNDIPFLAPSNVGHPKTDWMYKIVPQTNSCLALVDNGMIWNRGKSLGGSSNLNFMVYMRGNPNDFDNWAELTQDPQWKYENVLPFFKKFENYHGNFPNAEYHGKDGPIWITSGYNRLVEEWLNSGKEFGYSVKDPNARQTSSFFPIEFNIGDGKRKGVYNGFIKPALSRPNLHVLRYAHVTKIILDSEKKATGVEYTRHGMRGKAMASKEVILSTGAIGSPQLLMLSGIGPAQHLRSLNITPLVDLHGVGQQLSDHVGVEMGPFLINESLSYIQERDVPPQSANEYLANHTGVFAYPSLASGLSLISTVNNTDWPNMAVYLLPIGISKDVTADGKSYNVKGGVIKKYLEGYEGRDAVVVGMILEGGLSRGSITLRSSDPFDPPLIDPNYFSNLADIRALVKASRFVTELMERSETWRKLNATLIPNHFPGCEEYALRTDEYYECFIRHYTETNWHYASTCRMGRLEDPMTVVDPTLMVKGVSNLRVADASVMPQITNANLNAPTMMIGEKAAEMILSRWLLV